MILTARGITKHFAGVTALNDVSFDVRSGEIHALMGENGAGKSTLMKILAGIHADYEGEIAIDDQPLRLASVSDAEAQGIAIIHQELNLVPELTVADNMFLGREPRLAGLAINQRLMRKTARDLLQRLGLDLDPDARVGSLRVGEQQLVEIAKALSLSARVLIMDEPTSALSQAECQRLFKIIRQLAAQGTAIIYISHRIDEVMELAHRITVLRDGRNVLTSSITDMDVNHIVAAMVGRELLEMPQETTRNVGDVVLSARNLTLAKRHVRGWRQVLSNVSFDVRRGEIFGIAGLLGSGRTEILETIFGCAEGDASGDIALDGRVERIRSPLDALRLGIGLVTEDRKSKGLQLSASVTDNVALPSVGRLSRFGRRSFAGERDLAKRAVKSLGIRCSGVEQLTMNLSGGNQQKVVIGKWLATKPRLLLLDEPTRGIDVGAKREIYELIFHLAREQHLAVVVVSSELPELLLLADRILVMSEGVQTGIVTRAEASEEAIMKLAAPRSRTRAA